LRLWVISLAADFFQEARTHEPSHPKHPTLIEIPPVSHSTTLSVSSSPVRASRPLKGKFLHLIDIKVIKGNVKAVDVDRDLVDTFVFREIVEKEQFPQGESHSDQGHLLRMRRRRKPSERPFHEKAQNFIVLSLRGDGSDNRW
jgi:hypothetical protein